ncbi:uncharacterized protein LOC124651628 [Lolium rigidum]|uniref:uncharacterized protein LOC124651628 n=1 Tax=Lolium rigidum TaxID=89674 RepID=UPI001F5C511E|nr:uncharacterized protein LOC124651628 [Lolium rigidum]
MASLSLHAGKSGTNEAWAFISDTLRKASLDSDLAVTVPPKPQQLLPLQRSSSRSHHHLHRQLRLRCQQSVVIHRTLPNRNSRLRSTSRKWRHRAPSFWTACTSCCHVHQYDCSYEACTVLCPSCWCPFFASAMPTPPPIVPGTDMYYCSWGFFPMGFPGGPAFCWTGKFSDAAATCFSGIYPMGPYLPLSAQAGIVEGNVAGGVGSEAAVSANVTAAVPVPLPANSTHVNVGAKKRVWPKGSKNKNVVIEID